MTLLFIIFAYFIPTVVAVVGRHRQAGAIGVLNVFLGWTVVGWVVALVWACMEDKNDGQRV